MSYTVSIHHIIFRTKYGVEAITEEHAEDLYKYIWGIVKNKKCHLIQINGMPDHLHLLVNIHPSIALADLVKTIKVSSNKWLKEQPDLFPKFSCWSRKYCALSYSIRDKEMIKNYIRKQKEHHKSENSKSEIKRLLTEQSIEIDDRYWHEV